MFYPSMSNSIDYRLSTDLTKDMITALSLGRSQNKIPFPGQLEQTEFFISEKITNFELLATDLLLSRLPPVDDPPVLGLSVLEVPQCSGDPNL